MTFPEAQAKVIEAIEGFFGRLAIMALLAVVAGLSAWVLESSIEERERMAALMEWVPKREAEIAEMHRRDKELADALHKLELSCATRQLQP